MRFLRPRAMEHVPESRIDQRKDLQEYTPADSSAHRRSASGLRHIPLAAHRNVTRLGPPRKHTCPPPVRISPNAAFRTRYDRRHLTRPLPTSVCATARRGHLDTGVGDARRASTATKVMHKVLAGDPELGSTFLSEIVPVKGVKTVGALRHRLRAGIMAASPHRDAAARFIAMLTPRGVWKTFGFEPAA
jgi:hypothetical protein